MGPIRASGPPAGKESWTMEGEKREPVRIDDDGQPRSFESVLREECRKNGMSDEEIDRWMEEL